MLPLTHINKTQMLCNKVHLCFPYYKPKCVLEKWLTDRKPVIKTEAVHSNTAVRYCINLNQKGVWVSSMHVANIYYSPHLSFPAKTIICIWGAETTNSRVVLHKHINPLNYVNDKYSAASVNSKEKHLSIHSMLQFTGLFALTDKLWWCRSDELLL